MVYAKEGATPCMVTSELRERVMVPGRIGHSLIQLQAACNGLICGKWHKIDEWCDVRTVLPWSQNPHVNTLRWDVEG